MPAIAVNPSFPLFTDADGQPLDDAYIYIGTANQNPVSNPITVYWDSALTVTAAQPIRTSGGYPVYNGSPSRFYTNSDYSILLRDKNGAFIYTSASETDFISSAFVTFIQSGTGAIATTVQAKLRETVSVKDFGAVGDGVTDDMAAFQLASNFLYAQGGGELELTNASYYLSQYTGSQVGGFACWEAIGAATISKIWVVPSNVRVVGKHGMTRILINGGSSSPFGYSTTANVLSFPGNEAVLAVTAATNTTRTVTLSDTTGLSAGMVVCLARRGGSTGGIPNTPSQERAPSQFLTVKTVVANTSVQFEEEFIHNFESVSGLLEIYRSTGSPAYPKNVFFENIEFSQSGGSVPYVLISRTFNAGLHNVKFKECSFSFGAAQKIRCGDIYSNNATALMTIESTSDVSIKSFTAEGFNNVTALGPLFFTDNCRDVHIGKYTATGYTKTGFAMLYSIEAKIDEVNLIRCGTAATYDEYAASLSIGMPARNSYATRAIAEADLFKLRNHRLSSVHIGKLNITGGSQLPVRLHDAQLTISDCYIEYNNASETAPFYIGRSGSRRSDATYYPSGGQVSLNIESCRIKTLSGSVCTLSCGNGVQGLFKAGLVTTTALASIGATTLTVSDGTKLLNSSGLYFVDAASNSANSSILAYTSVSENTVTLSSALTVAIPSGTELWTNVTHASNNERVFIGTLDLDGVVYPPASNNIHLFPNFITGGGPYTDTIDITVPARGEWLLEVSNMSTDNAHYEKRSYEISYDPQNSSFPVSAISERLGPKARTNATVNGATISGTTVTVTIGNSASGKTGAFRYRWTPLRQITWV